jgi:alanine racemase
MGRIGVLLSEAEDLLRFITKLENIELVGVMTHFPVSDSEDDRHMSFTREQVDGLLSLRAKTHELFGDGVIFHSSNSGGTTEHNVSLMDMVRPGIVSYGYPEPIGVGQGLEVSPVMEVVSRVSMVKQFPKGHSVGYGRTYLASDQERIGVVPVGYADGLHRSLSNKLTPIIGGVKTQNVGRVSMDQFSIRVFDETKAGDEVVIIGRRGSESNSALDMAGSAGTISYEILCSLGNARRLRTEWRI